MPQFNLNYTGRDKKVGAVPGSIFYHGPWRIPVCPGRKDLKGHLLLTGATITGFFKVPEVWFPPLKISVSYRAMSMALKVSSSLHGRNV